MLKQDITFSLSENCRIRSFKIACLYDSRAWLFSAEDRGHLAIHLGRFAQTIFGSPWTSSEVLELVSCLWSGMTVVVENGEVILSPADAAVRVIRVS